MKHGSLFSGIGGFDLAAEWCGWENIFHCEWNPFGQKVLKHHFPNSISYNDITKTDFSIHRGNIDILTGGFPCQPYSTAGLRKGKADERHLFPEMLRAIKEIQPTWVIGENVRGLVSWGGDWYSTRCAMTWKGKDMKSSRLLFQLQVSTHRTKEKEYGLLLTPTTREQVQDLDKFKKRMEKYPNGTTMPNLATQISSLMLPTPTARCWNTGTDIERTDGITRRSELNHLMAQENGKPSQLSPLFVEEMMGFPENWTALPFQNGETSQLKPMETQ